MGHLTIEGGLPGRGGGEEEEEREGGGREKRDSCTIVNLIQRMEKNFNF